MSPVLYLVIPCYNEKDVLPITSQKILLKLCSLIEQKKISDQSKILFIDDGSKDETWNIIKALSDESQYLEGVKLLANRGHQNALFAGLMVAKDHCDIAISMDADMQDDIEVIDEFIEKYNDGCAVVYGVRKSRNKDKMFKRSTAQGFYRFMSKMGVDLVYNHADYRLMSNKALETLSDYKEVNLFLRGIVPIIGFKTDCVYYDRNERAAGKSKYSVSKMFNLAIDGITSFSVKPLRIIAVSGMIIAVLSVLFGLAYAIGSKIVGTAVEGWAALIVSIWTLGGIQLFCTGVLGEYIGKIYSEVKQRPRYEIENITFKQDDMTI